MIDWQRIWNDEDKFNHFSPTRAILYLLSLFYRLIINLRNWLYDKQIFASVRLACPVISVGNITVGGTGKTPFVMLLAKILQKHGFHPAVISRGYGSKSAQKINIVSDGERILLDAQVAGDEPLLIARSLPGVPVITGIKRIVAGSVAINKFGANVIICDDAFQHRQIARDIDLVLLDYEKPLSNGHLLPGGALREPVRRLNRADCLVITRVDETKPASKVISEMAQAGNMDIFYSVHMPKDIITGYESIGFLPEKLKGKKVCVFCGIANPNSFKKMLLDAQAQVVCFDPFPDHYFYSLYDLEELKNKFISYRADYLLTTEKDAMRLQAYPEFIKTICILRVEMKIIPSDLMFENFILQRLAGVGRQLNAKIK